MNARSDPTPEEKSRSLKGWIVGGLLGLGVVLAISRPGAQIDQVMSRLPDDPSLRGGVIGMVAGTICPNILFGVQLVEVSARHLVAEQNISYAIAYAKIRVASDLMLKKLTTEASRQQFCDGIDSIRQTY